MCFVVVPLTPPVDLTAESNGAYQIMVKWKVLRTVPTNLFELVTVLLSQGRWGGGGVATQESVMQGAPRSQPLPFYIAVLTEKKTPFTYLQEKHSYLFFVGSVRDILKGPLRYPFSNFGS